MPAPFPVLLVELDQALEDLRGDPGPTPPTAATTRALTLATALLAAFATGVIGTRWPIDDEVNAVFLAQLHAQLRTGSAPAQALREAQLSMLDGPTPQPSAWATYVHHGC